MLSELTTRSAAAEKPRTRIDREVTDRLDASVREHSGRGYRDAIMIGFVSRVVDCHERTKPGEGNARH
jgi:hypothetical protein